MLLPLIAVFNIGCDSTSENALNSEGGKTGVSLSGLQPTNVTFGRFEVTYTGRVYDGTSTTFSYSVTGPDKAMHFRLGWNVAECTLEPTSWTPLDGTVSSTDCCINPGLEWVTTPGYNPYVTHYFSYTFNGDIPEGIVPASVKCKHDLVLGEVAGPGIPSYRISGTVFQDANADALLSVNETFVSNVTISLLQDGSPVSSTTSDGDGYYEFTAPCGTYSVEVDTATLTGTQQTYFLATTALAYEVSIGPDSPGNNFGFDVNSTKLVEDLEAQTLPTSGWDTKFWKKEFLFGSKGRTFVYTPAELLAFLETIEGLALENPFVFPEGDTERLTFVYEILKRPSSTDFEAFEAELLTLELNYVSGEGIDLSTELVLIGWGESLYNAPGGTNPKGVIIEAAGTIQDATSVFRGINSNKSTGGGGTQ